MRIATFNINNVRKRLPNLLEWLGEAEPDVVCLQKLKTSTPELPVTEIEAAGYGAVWCGERAWNGVAILARGAEPVLTRAALPGDRSDRQRRYLEAAVEGVLIGSVYAPNGNPQPGPKFDYKLRWLARLAHRAADLLVTEIPVVLAGDFNVVPEPSDIHATNSYDDDALVQPEARRAFQRLLDQGWCDAVRRAHPETTLPTFWDCRRNRWPRDAGLRLDHGCKVRTAAV